MSKLGRAALVAIVALVAVVGFSLAVVPGQALALHPAGAGTNVASPSSSPAAPRATGPITPLAHSSSGLSLDSATELGQYVAVPFADVPAGSSVSLPSLSPNAGGPVGSSISLPSDITATVALTPSGSLENFVNELNDPNNPMYRQFLTLNEVGDEFGATSYATAVSYFESYGLSVQVSSGLLTLSITGTPSQMGAAFHTTFSAFDNEYQSNGVWVPSYGAESAVAGTTEYSEGYYANTQPLALPASLEGVVAGVAGLSGITMEPALTLPAGMAPNSNATSLNDPTVDTIQGLSDHNYTWYSNPPSNEFCEFYNLCGDVQTLYPSSMAGVDGAANLWSGTDTISSEPDLGQGITIAVIEVGCLDLATIQGFSSEVWNSASQPGTPLSDRITQIDLNSPGGFFNGSQVGEYNACLYTGEAYGWTAETALDVEYAATEAPDAHIDVVAVNSSDFSAFDVAYADVAQYLSDGQTTLPGSVGTVVGIGYNATDTQELPAGSSSITITSNSYGEGEEYAAFTGAPMYLTVEDTLLEELNAVGVTNFFSSGDYSGAAFDAANQAGMPAVSPGSTSVGGGQVTASSYGAPFPETNNIICTTAGYEYVGTYNGAGYCSEVVGIAVGVEPIANLYDSANGYIYEVNLGTDDVSVISGNSVVATVFVGECPIADVLDPSNGYVYVANQCSNSVSVINGTSVVATVNVGEDPWWDVYDSSNGYVYVVDEGSSDVSILNGTSLVTIVSVGAYPEYAVYDSSNGYVYVSDSGTDNMTILSGTSAIANVTVGEEPYGSAVDTANGDVYVANFGSSTVSVLSGTSVVGTVSVGSDPDTMVYDSSDGYIYVACLGTSSVSILSGTSVVGSASVGDVPWKTVYDSLNSYVYVSNTYSDTVSVISGTSTIATVGVGEEPYFLAVDTSNGDVYEGNLVSNTVTIIEGTTAQGITLTPEECYEYGVAEGICSGVTYVAPATGLASFSYWAYGEGLTGTFFGEVGGAFGQSIAETQPWYQNGLDTYSTGAAIDPIVSFSAAFNMTIYDVAEFGGWEANYGGTSFASPTVAGEWALIEEQANAAYGTPKMGDINPLLFEAHNAHEAGVSSFSANPYVDMQNLGFGFDTAPLNSFNWYYYNLSIEQPYDAVLPGWFNTLFNPAGSGWNYLQGLGAIQVNVLDNELIGQTTEPGFSLSNPAFEVEMVTSDDTLVPLSGETLTAGTTYDLKVVNTDGQTGVFNVEAYSGQSSAGAYGGGTLTTLQTKSDGEFSYKATSGIPPGGGGATTYGYFLVTSVAGNEWSFAQVAVAQPAATGSLSLCVVNPQGVCETGTAEVTTFTTGYTGFYNLYPEAYVTLNGVPAAAAVVTEVSVNVALFENLDPTMPLSSYAPGATLGNFITGTMGDTNFWTDAFTAELNGYLPTQVVTLTATYGGLTSNTVTVFLEPQSGSYDTSDLSLNSAGTAVVGTLTFSGMKYVNFVNVSIGSAPGQFQNVTYPPEFYDSSSGLWVSLVSSGQIAVDLSTAGLEGPIQISLVASGTNDLTITECEGIFGCIYVNHDVQNPIVWSDPLTFLPARVALATAGTVTGVDDVAWSGTAYAGATGTLSLVWGGGSEVLGTYALGTGDATSGTYALNTASLLDGYYSVIFTETAPGVVTTTATASFYSDNQAASDSALISELESQLTADAATITTLQSTVSTLQSTVASLEGEVASLQSQVAALQSENAANASAVATLQGELATANGTIASLTGEVSTLTSQVATLQSSLSAEQGTAASLQAQLTALEADNAANATEVATLQSQLTAAQATIASDQATITSDQTSIASDTAELSSDTAQVASLTAEVQTLQNELNAKKNYVAPAWYDMFGTLGIALLVGFAAVVVGLGAYFGGRRAGRKSPRSYPGEGAPNSGSESGSTGNGSLVPAVGPGPAPIPGAWVGRAAPAMSARTSEDNFGGGGKPTERTEVPARGFRTDHGLEDSETMYR